MKGGPAPGVAAVQADVFVEPVAAGVPAQLATQPTPDPSPASKARPSYLRAHRWQVLAAFAVLIGGGTLAVRWWMGPQVSTESALRPESST